MTFWITVLLSVLVLTTFLGWRSPTPILSIVNRWLRWFLFSFLCAYLVAEFSESPHSFWILVVIAFLTWFLLETMYNWLVISILSKSPIPLFPSFRENTKGDEWPSQPRFIQLREWLRKNSFVGLQAVRAEVADELQLRSSIYQSEDGRLRLQILFIPQQTGAMAASYVLTSLLADGRRLITDNIFLPFGGYYPAQWEIDRRPLSRSLPRLITIHEKRLKKVDTEIVSWNEEENEPVDELNDQQRRLEKTNTELGFLIPRAFQEEYGRLSVDGRYRIWKEIWLLNYLGLTVSYRSPAGQSN